MNVRRRLVAGFVALSIFVLLLYGVVAHRTAVDVGVSAQLHLLYDFAAGEAHTLKIKTPDDTHTLLNSDVESEFESIVVTIENEEPTRIDRLRGELLSDTDLSFVRDLVQSGETRGAVVVEGIDLLWAVSQVPFSNQQLFLFYNDHHERTESDYGSMLETRLVVTAVVIIWIAIWMALVASKRIIQRLDEQSTALLYKSTYDELTDLPNRSTLFKALDNEIEQSDPAGEFSVLVLDIDRFKEVNDTIGHHRGDKLLHMLADRFKAQLAEDNPLYRLGGDEFAILTQSVKRSAKKKLVSQLLGALNEPFHLNGIDIPIDVSIGSANYPGDAEDAITLVKRAEVAMYQAKSSHMTFLIYDPKQDPYSVKRLSLMSELRTAIKDQIVLFYQPKADLLQQRTTSVEVLVRWQHPKHGLIPPDDFISIAESSGMMHELTLRIMELAMAQLRDWIDQGLNIQVAINLSVINLLDRDLPGQVRGLLEGYQIEPKYLKFEITESSLMSDPELAMSTLQQLDQMGIGLSIDDFGTGFSSLSYLKCLPVSELKIDRVFVSDMMNDNDDKVIVKSTIELAHNMNCSVVAEGIEDLPTYNYLIELGCDVAQGYYLSRPLPAEQLAEWFDGCQWPPVRFYAQMHS